MAPPDDLNIPSDPTGQPFDDGTNEDNDNRTDRIFASKSKNAGEDDDLKNTGKKKRRER